jgi:hypothetical protein
MDHSMAIVEGIEKTISSLQMAIGAIDVMVRQPNELRYAPQSTPASQARENSK